MLQTVLCGAACAAAAYLLGSLSFSIIVTRLLYHKDIRTFGSGNAGMTNVLRTFGKGAAALTIVGDIGKGILAVLLAKWAFGAFTAADPIYGAYIAAFCAVLGHVYPVYFGFKGGKGILVSVAVLMTVEWIPACILLGIFIIVVALTRYVSLGSCLAAVCYPVTILVYSLITGDPCVWINVVLSALIAVLILFMHRGNLVRLKNHTEKKLGQKA